MSMIALAEMPAAVQTRPTDTSTSFKAIFIFCCLGLVASFSLMAHGIDLSASLI